MRLLNIVTAMPASARLAHVADLCAIWYQFNQYTPLAGRVPTVGVLTGFAVSVERHGEVIFDEELTCFILAGRRDACGDGVIDFRYDPLPPVALP